MSATRFILKQYAVTTWLLVGGLCVLCTASIWGYTLDDAYIVYRYARNLVEGQGAVFNVGERVEGFSSPLWLAVATLAEAVHLPVEHCCKVVSLAVILATFAYVLRRLRGLSPIAILPLVALGTCGSLHAAIACGLETAVNAALLVFLFLASNKHRVPPAAGGEPDLAATECSPAGLALWGSLALLCRPENGLLVGVQGLYLWCERPRQRRGLYIAAGTWLTVGAALTMMRFAYYGTLLPNTAVAKISTDAAFRAGGLFYCFSWLKQYGWYFLPAFAAVASPSTRRLAANAGLLIAAQVGFVMFVGGDWMPQWRFLLPVLVLLVVVGCYGLHALARSVRRKTVHSAGTARLALAAACPAVVAFLIVTQLWHFRTLRWSLDYYRRQLEALANGPVRFLADHAAANDLVAARDIGILGYKTRCRVLDMVGLTDPHIAQSSGYRHRNRIDVDYIYGLKPAYLMLQTGNERAEVMPLDGIALALVRHGQFQQYTLCRRWDLPGRQYCELYTRTKPESSAHTAMIVKPE